MCGFVSTAGLIALSLLSFRDGGALPLALFVGGIIAVQSALIWLALLYSPLRSSRFWQATVLVGGSFILDSLIMAVAIFVSVSGTSAEAAAVTAIFGGLAYAAPLAIPLAAGGAAAVWIVDPSGPLRTHAPRGAAPNMPSPTQPPPD